MSKFNSIKATVCLLLIANATTTNLQATPSGGGRPGTETLTEKQASELMKNSGTGFIKNAGQVFDMNKQPCPEVYYQYQLNEAAIYLTKRGISFAFYKKDKVFEPQNIVPSKTDLIPETTGKACRLDVNLIGATILKQNIIEEELNYSAGKMNLYFNDFSEVNSNLYYSKKLIVKEVYPKIDWVITMNDETGLKQEFIVHPGADYNDIMMAYDGVSKLTLNESKDAIYAKTDLGDVNDVDLKCYTQSGKVVKSSYTLSSKNEVRIQVAKYNSNEDLIIDPQVSLSRTWATYLGGNSEDFIHSNKIDIIKSQLYVVGETYSAPFPPLSLTQGTIGINDAFVCCFALDGTKKWCSLFGSSAGENFNCVTIDGNSNVIAAGFTSCTSATAVKYPLLNAGGYFQSWSAPLPVNPHPDAMITKMDVNGVVKWSSIFGGAGQDIITGITTNSTNEIIICGNTLFTDYIVNNVPNYFPYLNAGGYFYSVGNTVNVSSSFIAYFKFNTQLKWSTLFKGCESFADVTCDVANNIYAVGGGNIIAPELTGMGGAYQQAANNGDGVIAEFGTATNLMWGTNFGGNGGEGIASCAINPTDNSLLICGTVAFTATNFPFAQNTGYFNNNYQLPSTGIAVHSFIAQFNTGHVEIWGTLFSGNGTDYATSVKVGSGGTIFLAGQNKRQTSPVITDNFPLYNPGTPFYFDNNANTGSYDGYIAMFQDIRTLRWCTYYGTTSCDEYTTDLDVAGKFLLYTGWANNTPNQSIITTQQEVATSWIQSAQGLPTPDGIIAKFSNQFSQNLKEIDGSQNPDAITLYQNPVSNGEVKLFIKDAAIKFQGNDFEIVDMLGQVIKVSVFSQNDNELNLKFNSLNDGVYILKVKTTIGIQTFKIINHE